MHSISFGNFFSDVEAEAANQGLVLDGANRMAAMEDELNPVQGLVNRIRTV
jgi:hypothetical protein